MAASNRAVKDQVLVVGHPHVLQVAGATARRHVAEGKAVMVDGILYWHRRARRGPSEPQPVRTHLDRDRGYFGPSRGEYMPRMSAEPGEGGPVVLQLEQGVWDAERD